MSVENPLLKVMLGSDLPVKVRYPLLCSFKYDGVRASQQRVQFYARSLKPIRNKFIQQFAHPLYDNLDGELVVGKVNEEATFRRSTSGVMSTHGEPEFTFQVFDCLTLDQPFKLRYQALQDWFDHSTLPHWLQLIEHRWINSFSELEAMLREALACGYEGIVARDPEAKYKHGRATAKGGQLMRWVPWETAEAEVIGFEEGQHNTNEATINELGRTNRSTDADGMVPSGRLGAFLVRDIVTEVEFKVGNGEGMTHAFCTEVWENQPKYMGKVLKYRHKVVGGYDKPRQAQFVGWRDPIDLGGG